MQNNNKKKCCIYARCSSPRQEAFRLHTQSQIEDCKKIAKRRNLEVKDIFTENKHASKPNSRPNFEIMLKRIKTGEYDSVICHTLDRLFRNESDSFKLSQLIGERNLKRIITAEGEFTPVFDTLPLSNPKKKIVKRTIR